MQRIWTTWCKVFILLVIIYQVDLMIHFSPRWKLVASPLDYVLKFIMPLLMQAWKIFFGQGIFFVSSFIFLFLNQLLKSLLDRLFIFLPHCSNVVFAFTAQGPEIGLCQCYFQIVCKITFSGKIIKKTGAAAKLKKLKKQQSLTFCKCERTPSPLFTLVKC